MLNQVAEQLVQGFILWNFNTGGFVIDGSSIGKGPYLRAGTGNRVKPNRIEATRRKAQSIATRGRSQCGCSRIYLTLHH